MDIRPLAVAVPVVALALAAAACAEPPRQDREAASADRPAADASAASPMTVNPAPQPGTSGQAAPQTPPTLPEDPAQQDDTAMPPGPVNPPR